MKKSPGNQGLGSATSQAVFCADPIKRPNYFQGRLLSADDFIAEQNYHREKMRRHNRSCHGSGVIKGLNVSIIHANSGWTVVIEPGVAIDPTGNEIHLCTNVTIRLPKSRAAIDVGVRFAERHCDPVSTLSDETTPGSQYSRVEEGCEVVLNLVPMSSPGAKIGTKSSFADVLPLALLVRNGSTWQVSPPLVQERKR